MSVEETGSLELFEGKQQEITRQELVERVSEHVNRILRRNLYELKLDEKQTFRLLRQKEELRRYLKEAGTGNLQVKEYLISFIQEFLLNGMKMDEEMIKHTFFFSEKGSRQAAVRFDILLFLYKEQYGSGAMEKLIEEHGLLSGTENVITEEQIEHVYGVCGRKLKFIEQIELLSRKIYAYYKGLGAIDELRDMKIDGVSGGVSGKEGTYHSAWIFYHGRSVWLPFLDFEREEEMERISRNLCRYHQPGEISRKKGYLVHEMADHARVVVARPDFAENWMFFIRKLDNIPEVSLQQLVTGGHAEIPVELLKWLMKGCQVTAVTGMQGCGKTTLLTAMVGEIPEEYTIRVLELAFELHLRERYQNRNIVTFRETAGMMEHGGIGGQEALEVQKKTDGAVSIIGEVVSAKVASWMIESGQTGSLFTIFTHHAKSTRSLLLSLRNSLLKEGSFQSERVALEQVTEVVRFDVHLHMSREGQRYIERISEIVPDTESPEGYRIVELVRFDGERYVKLHTISETTRAEMVKWLTKGRLSVEETGSLELFEGKQQEITRQELVERVSEHVNRILRRNLYELKLDEKQTFRLLRQKEELRRYLKEAGTGNLQVKEYLISFIQEFLLNGMKMDEEMIKHTFFFSEKGSRQAAVRFDILLFLYKEQYGSGAMEKLIEEHGLLSGTENVITEEQIEHVYGVCGRKLKFIEQIELLSRKIYAYYKGLGAIDELRDMKIDGVSGGVSGKEGTYHSAWIFYHGRSVWLPFLDFEREEEMERISRNLCRYHQPGEISRKKGYLVHEMADHARVVVARPDFAENWMFFIRKLDNIPEVSLQQLVTGGHAEIPVELLKWLMKGCQVTAVTGMQGCGKTTLLTAMVGEIPEEYTIRVLELAFELHLRERYQNRNIVTFRETAGMMEHGGIGGQEALEVQKKTDGAVSIIGEVVSAKVASWMIESGQTGSLFTIFTHHAKSTRSLLLSLRNSLLKEGSFQSERVALEQVTEVVRFDVHLHMSREGQRYIERISEIVPDTESPEGYRIVELVRFDGERYVKLHTISETTRAEMVKWLTKEEKEAFFNVDI